MDYVLILNVIYYASYKSVQFGYTNFFSVRFMQQLKK